VKESGFWT